MTSFKTLKESVSIKMILEHYKLFDTLVKRGGSLRGNCPFCESDEGQPFSVSLKKSCFNSFCCGKHGNILDFVAEREHISIKQAADKLAEEFITKEGETKKSKIPEVKDTLVVETITEEKPVGKNSPLAFTLKGIDASHEMVPTLGILEETARTFGAGFYTGRGMFKNHFVMPIYSFGGDLMAYTGIDPQNPNNHLYPKQFNRGRELYGKYRFADREHTHTPLILCRHPLQVLVLAQNGYEAVALMHESITNEQVSLLSHVNGVGSVLTLLLSHNDHKVVEVLNALITHFHVRLVRYTENSDSILGFVSVEDVDLLKI